MPGPRIRSPFSSSGVGLRPPMRMIAITRPKAAPTRSGSSDGVSVTIGIYLGQADRQRLIGILEVDHLSHEPAVIDGVVEVIFTKVDLDRKLEGIHAHRPVKVAHHLDDRIELQLRAGRGYPRPAAGNRPRPSTRPVLPPAPPQG